MEISKVQSKRSILLGYFTNCLTENAQSNSKSLVLSSMTKGIEKITDGEISRRIFGWRDLSRSDHEIIFSNIHENNILHTVFPMAEEISLVDLGPLNAHEEDGVNLKLENIRRNIRRACSALCQRTSIGLIEVDPSDHPKIVAESAVYGTFHRNEIEHNGPRNSYFFNTDSDLSSVYVQHLFVENASEPTKESLDAFEEGVIIGESQNFARLLHGAGFYETKAEFINHVKEKFSGLNNVKFINRDEAWIESMGLKSILKVANMNRKCSDGGKYYFSFHEPPCLLEIHYDSSPTSQPIVLVGRSSFYHSSDSYFMTENRQPVHLIQNVSGGASIIATILALARLKASVKIIGIVAMCQHSFSWRRSMNMKIESEYEIFSEVPDSHEEGLILKDVLSYSCSFEPELLISVATQTNYLTEAFQTYTSVIYSSDDWIAELFLKVCFDTGERFIRLPFVSIDDDVVSEKCIVRNQFWNDCSEMLNRSVPPEDISTNYDSCFVTSCYLKHLLKDRKWLHLELNKDLLFHKNNEDEVFELHEITGSPTRSFVCFIREILRNKN